MNLGTPQPPKIIFFDIGGTLLCPYPSVSQVYTEVAAKYGISVDRVAVKKAFPEAFRNEAQRRIDAAKEACEACPPIFGTSDEEGRAFWRIVVKGCFDECAQKQVMSDENFEAFFSDVYEVFARPEGYAPSDRTVADTLEELKARGIRRGVISNWDTRLRRILEGGPFAEYLDPIIVSSEIGTEKPHRRIFKKALAAVGLKPGQAWHVGDSWAADVKGAAKSGIRPVFFDPHQHGIPEGKEVPANLILIQQMSDLLSHL